MKDDFIKALKDKKIVGFPTDTVYGIGCILDKECVERLRELKKRDVNKPFAILISDTSWLKNLNVYIPDYSIKLIQEMKGPLTVVFKIKDKNKYEFITKEQKIGVRIPDDDFLCEVIKELGEPIVATSANISGFAPVVSPEELDIKVDYFIRGKAKLGIHSTVVDISGERPIILRKGAKPILEIEAKVGELLISNEIKLNLLFVCSGNTCRSPMAEYHFRALSKEENRFELDSCGTLNIYGNPPTPEAIIVMEEIDIDISSHRSKGLSNELVNYSDIILPMSKIHLEILTDYGVNKYKLLPFYNILGKKEIPDPIGKGLPFYRKVRDIIIETNKALFEILNKKFVNISEK